MKLSEALREGAKKHKQYFGYYEGPENSRCAVGAIFSALGQDRIWGGCRSMHDAVPILFEGEHTGDCLLDEIVTQNDHEKKSFEEIAQWLEERGY